MSKKPISLIFFLTQLILIYFSTTGVAATYGVDNRVDIDVAPAAIKNLASATALMVSPIFVLPNATGSRSVTLDFQEYAGDSDYRMCPEVKFAKQPANGVTCTGFLVADDLLMTAGHCMINTGSIFNGTTPFCTDFLWVFDFQKPNNAAVNITDVSEDQIYRCSEVVYAGYDTKVDPVTQKYIYNEDFALIRLDRKVSDHRPRLSLSPKPVAINAPLSALGYPTGLPLKYSSSGRVLDMPTPHYFRSNLDMLMGNSGSPIFDTSNSVVGIEVRGYPEDLVWDKNRNCHILNHCSEDTKTCLIEDTVEGHGEHHYPAINILRKLKKLGINL